MKNKIPPGSLAETYYKKKSAVQLLGLLSRYHAGDSRWRRTYQKLSVTFDDWRAALKLALNVKLEEY